MAQLTADLEHCRKMWKQWFRIAKPQTVFHHSSTFEQLHDFEKVTGVDKRTFPNFDKQTWDLNQPPSDTIPRVDVAVICNVFYYSPDPALWFNNVLSVCRELWLQDLSTRFRGINKKVEFGDDGDCCRFVIGYDERRKYRIDSHYEVLDFATYNPDAPCQNDPQISHRNFIARIRGKLA